MNHIGKSETSKASTIMPGAAQAIAYHNHEADAVHSQAVEALKLYNAAMGRLQRALAVGDGDAATIAETQADAAWSRMHALLQQGYQHRNSAAIAAGMAAEIDGGKKA